MHRVLREEADAPFKARGQVESVAESMEDQKTETGHMTDMYPCSWIHFTGSERHIQCYTQVSKKQNPRTTQGWETCFVAHNSPVVVEPPTPQTHAALRGKGRED